MLSIYRCSAPAGDETGHRAFRRTGQQSLEACAAACSSWRWAAHNNFLVATGAFQCSYHYLSVVTHVRLDAQPGMQPQISDPLSRHASMVRPFQTASMWTIILSANDACWDLRHPSEEHSQPVQPGLAPLLNGGLLVTTGQCLVTARQ